MKQMRLFLAAFFACVLAVTGIFAFAPQALAEETSLGNVIDMRECDLVEVPIQRTGEQSFAESALAAYVWSHNGEISYTGTKPFFDMDKSVTFKLLLPYQVSFAAMQIMFDAGGKISFSKDGTVWNAEDSVVKPNPEWAELDITAYLGHEEENLQDVVYVRIEDSTPEDGSGPIIRILNFICAQDYDFSDETVTLPALTEEAEDRFFVAPGHEDSTEAEYLITNNGQEQPAGGFRFFDGAGASYAAAREQYLSGYSWSNLAVYKFTYSEQALALKLKVEIGSQYRIDVATELDETLDATFYEADALSANGAPWTRVAVGTAELVAENYVTIDITQFMQDNTDRTIYVKVSDPTSWYGGGACLFSMSLIETRAAAAPVVTVNEGAATEVYAGQTLNLSELFAVETVDQAPTVAYTLDGEPLDDGMLTAEEGTYTVRLTVTDANGATGYAETEVTVLPAAVTGITLKSAPEKTEYKTGAELELTGAVITLSYTDGTTQDVDVTAAMVSGFDAQTAGEQTLTVTYEGFTVTFDVTVKAGGCGGQIGGCGAEWAVLLILGGLLLTVKRIRAKA